MHYWPHYPFGWSRLATLVGLIAFSTKISVSRFLYHCDAVDVSILAFDEIDESGKTVRPAWIIQTASNNPLKVVKFGTTPLGWTLVKSAIRLEPAKFYRVEGQVFTCRAGKPNNVCTVMP